MDKLIIMHKDALSSPHLLSPRPNSILSSILIPLLRIVHVAPLLSLRVIAMQRCIFDCIEAALECIFVSFNPAVDLVNVRVAELQYW